MATAPVSSDAAHLISGDALKTAALDFIGEMRAKVEREQGGLLSIFDSWFTRVVTRLIDFDPARSWEDSVRDHAAQSPGQNQNLQWDLLRMRLFLDRWRQGRFVEFSRREMSAVHYHPRFGTEFGVDVLLTCQGAPSLMRWRGVPLMKNVFDFAMYPALLAELRPRTVFEIGSGHGASATWFADSLAFCGGDARVHSVDRCKAEHRTPAGALFSGRLRRTGTVVRCRSAANRAAPVAGGRRRPPQRGGGPATLSPLPRARAIILWWKTATSNVRRMRQFLGAHPGSYLVDTHFTDYFGRNATCAANSIFVRTKMDKD